MARRPSANEVIQSLRKRPELFFQVAWDLVQVAHKERLAGPWDGPRDYPRTRRGIGKRVKRNGVWVEPGDLREWVRKDLFGNTIARIHQERYDFNPMADKGIDPDLFEWGAEPVSLPKTIAGEEVEVLDGHMDSTGECQTLEEAMHAADGVLQRAGWHLTGYDPLIAGPWEQKYNHWCRYMVSGSKRPQGTHEKLAVVRKLDGNVMWSWGILDRENPKGIVLKGEEENQHRAMSSCDVALRGHGWDLR